MVMNSLVGSLLDVHSNFEEFDFHANGVSRYANNSNYRNDSLIRKESIPHLFQLLITSVCFSSSR